MIIIRQAWEKSLGIDAIAHSAPKTTPPTWLRWLVPALSMAIETPNIMAKDTNKTMRVSFLWRRNKWISKRRNEWGGRGGAPRGRKKKNYLFNNFQLRNISVINIPTRPYIPPLAPTTAMHEPSTTELHQEKEKNRHVGFLKDCIINHCNFVVCPFKQAKNLPH